LSLQPTSHGADTPDAFTIPRVFQGWRPSASSQARNNVFDAMVADLYAGPRISVHRRGHPGRALQPLAPYANGLPGHANRVGDLAIVQSLGGTPHDLGSLGISACDLATPSKTLQNIALVRAQLDRDRLPALPAAIVPSESQARRITVRDLWLEFLRRDTNPTLADCLGATELLLSNSSA
jgi:hypothetical protein